MALAKITDSGINGKTKVIEDCHKKTSSVIYTDPISSMVIFKVPFKIRIRNVVVLDQYSPNNPPPIGIAIIGFNNYIL